ncbi:eye-specific diacylglycerol kinase-like protein [Corchorus olitorius]|uniref:Eye-specific diacylglycerol kinase-like protein n=1 Tax=Corchorus olitorius TaxID=93759 RepID=A0A1R3H482_9ROSI|nr:eye-specific diacylglycerol kinase-like protein [Corchorus olitorius]
MKKSNQIQKETTQISTTQKEALISSSSSNEPILGNVSSVNEVLPMPMPMPATPDLGVNENHVPMPATPDFENETLPSSSGATEDKESTVPLSPAATPQITTMEDTALSAETECENLAAPFQSSDDMLDFADIIVMDNELVSSGFNDILMDDNEFTQLNGDLDFTLSSQWEEISKDIVDVNFDNSFGGDFIITSSPNEKKANYSNCGDLNSSADSITSYLQLDDYDYDYYTKNYDSFDWELDSLIQGNEMMYGDATLTMGPL